MKSKVTSPITNINIMPTVTSTVYRTQQYQKPFALFVSEENSNPFVAYHFFLNHSQPTILLVVLCFKHQTTQKEGNKMERMRRWQRTQPFVVLDLAIIALAVMLIRSSSTAAMSLASLFDHETATRLGFITIRSGTQQTREQSRKRQQYKKATDHDMTKNWATP